MDLRPRFLPPPLDANKVERLTTLAEQIVRAIDKKNPTRELIARFEADAGTRVTQFEFHKAASEGPVGDFVERVLTPDPAFIDVNDREAAEIVRRVRSAEGSTRERHFWVKILERALAQPDVAALVFHPDQQYTPDEVVALARNNAGGALARHIAPAHRGPVIARALLKRLLEKRQIVLRAGASHDDLIRGIALHLDRPFIGPKQVHAISEWLLEQPTVEELFADEAKLELLLGQV